MKNIIKGIGIILGCAFMASCQELSFWDSFLGEQPESSGATTEKMFSSRTSAEQVLTKAYTGLPYGLPTSSTGGYEKLGGGILEAITDLCYTFRDNISDGPTKVYYNGALSPNTVGDKAAYFYGGEPDWTTIRYAWLYIENVDKVPDMSAGDKNERIAEAKTLIALSYFEMLRYIGGVPWLDHAVSANEAMEFPRITFAESISKIVGLLDEAIPYMPWKQEDVDDGRMSKAGAMALKFKVLQWAASPLVNSNEKWHPDADEYTCYGNYNVQRWKDAAEAGKLFFKEIENMGRYELIQPEEPTHTARRQAYRKAYYDRGGTEILISTRRGYGVGTHEIYMGNRYYTGPTLNYVDMFPWENGDEFPADFNWEAPQQQPFFVYSGAAGMVPTRDPRLYENAACPGDTYYNGTTAPVYTNHASYRFGSGFLIMKYVLQEEGNRANRPVQWPHTRLSEIMLGYAEVLNEVNNGPTTEAHQKVNAVRTRVGLSELPLQLSKAQFLEAVLKERALELGFEEVRWFDLVRWKRDKDFTKVLYGLQTKGNDLNNPTAFTFKKVQLAERFWSSRWDTKWYLTPIPQNEINKKYGMTQNPGW